ncbi:MAG: hypothetical protein BYD32DRAFT_132783 [Podila humilis]|nr:MAG: hypothetical protein BYD32DRAFT_132783 [Podila humilis]
MVMVDLLLVGWLVGVEDCGGKRDSKLCARCASGMGCGGWMEEEGRFFVTGWSVCQRAIKKKKRKKEKKTGQGLEYIVVGYLVQEQEQEQGQEQGQGQGQRQEQVLC